jgi:hypothetical protein
MRANWKALLVLVIVSAIAIMVLEPDYSKLQGAKDADEFRSLLDHPGRAMLATIADMIFAVGYGLLGVVGFRAHAPGTLFATIGSFCIAAGATCDEIENVFVLTNIIRREQLTDAWINAMQVPGTFKWIGTVGFLMLFGLLIVRGVQRRTASRESAS